MTLKELRKSKGITQKEMAKLLGMNEVSIVRYEKGTIIPPVDVFVRMCKILKLNNTQKLELLKELTKERIIWNYIM